MQLPTPEEFGVEALRRELDELREKMDLILRRIAYAYKHPRHSLEREYDDEFDDDFPDEEE